MVPTTNDDVIIENATLVLEDISTINSLSIISNVIITGSGTINVNNTLEISNGSECTIDVEMNCSGPATLGNIELTLNDVTLNLQGGGSIADDAKLMLINSGVFKIPSGAIFSVLGKLNVFGLVNIPTFIVEGTLNKSGAGTLDFEAAYLFENAIVNILAGDMVNFYAGAVVSKSLNSTINISPGATLTFARSADIENTNITGEGKIRVINPGTPSFDMGTTITDTEIEISGGILFLEEGMSVPAVYQTGGQFGGNDITVTGNYIWEGGFPSGTKTIEGRTMITDITNSVETRGCSGCNVIVAGGGVSQINDNILQGKLTIPADTSFAVIADEDCTFEEIIVMGTLVKTGSADLTLNSFFQFNAEGTIKGEEIIKSSFMVNRGSIQPGLPLGKLVMETSTLLLEGESTIEIELEASNGIISNDLLEGSGNITLDGTLIVTENGMIPNGDYTIITAEGIISDTFINIQLPTDYSIIYDSNSVILRKEIVLTDNDNDGFFSDVDCDDMNADINPEATEIPNNGIDEDCDGMDLMTSISNIDKNVFQFFPNPFSDLLNIKTDIPGDYYYQIRSLIGTVIQEGAIKIELTVLSLPYMPEGVYILSIAYEGQMLNYRILKRSGE